MLHPQTRALLDLIEDAGLPPTHMLTPTEARRAYRDRRALTQPDAPDVALLRELRAEGPAGHIALRLYRALGSAPDEKLPCLVYYHGGGWTIGDLDSHDTLCRELANRSGCAVLSVDYRLAPEHRFPAALDDCVAATWWLHRNAAALGLDAARMAVGGDSAGGNLAAAVAIIARDRGDLSLALQLLIYPVTDMRRVSPSHRSNGQGYLLTSDSLAYYHHHYIDDPAHDLDWRASPLLCENLSALPPALVITAGYDPLRDEGLQYAQRLTEAGNRATYLCFERQIHGFVTMGKVIDEAGAAVALCASAVRDALRT